MKCKFCDNECQELMDQWGRPIYCCHQADHIYEMGFDPIDGISEILKIDDKIYFGHQVEEHLK